MGRAAGSARRVRGWDLGPTQPSQEDSVGREGASWTLMGAHPRAEGWWRQGLCYKPQDGTPGLAPSHSRRRGDNVHALEGTGPWGRAARPLTRGHPRSQTAEAAVSCLGAAGQRPALSAQSSACAGSQASSASGGSAAGPAGRWGGGQEGGGLWSAQPDHRCRQGPGRAWGAPPLCLHWAWLLGHGTEA